MEKQIEWFEKVSLNDHLISIREKLSEVDPRFLTEYTNLYLLIGSHSALLIDTGCGLYPLRAIINSLIEDKKLIVVNTHSHWDHVGGNYEFDEVHIHEVEAKLISKPLNISLLKGSSKEIVNRFNDLSFSIPPAPLIRSIKDGEIFDLGDLELEVIFTPGHSNGSISLLSNDGELFTGDTVHYGSVFLPTRLKHPTFISSLLKLIALQENNKINSIYPSHEQIPADPSIIKDLHYGISNIDQYLNTRKKDKFLRSWILDGGQFQFVIPKL